MWLEQSVPRVAGAVVLVVASGCSSGGGAPGTGDGAGGSGPAVDPELGIAPPAAGFQVRTVGTTIAPGEDVEYCEIAEVPGEPSDVYWVSALEFANAAGSHHLIVTTATPGSPTDQELRSLDVGVRVPCLSAGAAFGAEGEESIGGTQTRLSRTDFPSGVGRRYQGGQRIVFDYHYFNAGEEPLAAKSAVNFHVAAPSTIQRIASDFGFYNYTIDTPPGASASFVGECRFEADVMVSNVSRHTHRQSTDFTVWFEGGPRHGEHVWTSLDWQHDTRHDFAEPVSLRAGEGFRFQCGFSNPGTRPLRFGTSASDEMCVLFGLLWTTDPAAPTPPLDCGITWVDAQGVGHAPRAAGGLPRPPASDALVCNAAQAALGAPADECTRCRCDACAPLLAKCALDTDCGAVLACALEHGCRDAECGTVCSDVLDAHSSATGLMAQISGCIEAGCPSCGGPTSL
jgi:hypothetical protein